MNDKLIRLNLTITQFAIIYALLEHIQLGARNSHEESISTLVKELDEDSAIEAYNICVDKCGVPLITFEDETIVLN